MGFNSGLKGLNIVKYYECVCSCLRYPACKSHLLCAPLYCFLCSIWRWHFFFFQIISYTARFSKNQVILHKIFAFIFSTIFFTWNIFHSRRIQRVCVCVFVQSTRNYCHILKKLKFSRRIFEKKNSQMSNLLKNPSSGGAELLGLTDGEDAANSRFSQFCQRGWKYSFAVNYRYNEMTSQLIRLV